MTWPTRLRGPRGGRLVNRIGTSAAPLASLPGAVAASTLFDAATDIEIPFESLYPGWQAVVEAIMEKSGAAGAVSNMMFKMGVGARSTGFLTVCNLNSAATDGAGAMLRSYLHWNGSEICATANNSGYATGAPVVQKFALAAGQTFRVCHAVSAVSAGDTAKLLVSTLDRFA